MIKRVSKIENFNYRNIVTLNQKTADKKYLILDIWENIKDDQGDKYQQIFLQINNMKILSISKERIYFDMTDRQDVISAMIRIEDSILQVLKDYLSKNNKRGRFNFCSIIKDNKKDATNKYVMTFSLNNNDYPISIYNSDNNKMNMSFLEKSNNKFNIIMELMYINFDMISGTIVIDTRLRLMIENKIKMKRIQLMDAKDFISDDNKNCDADNIADIQKSFELTQTEVFEDDNDDDNDDDVPPICKNKSDTAKILSEKQIDQIDEELQSTTSEDSTMDDKVKHTCNVKTRSNDNNKNPVIHLDYDTNSDDASDTDNDEILVKIMKEKGK